MISGLGISALLLFHEVGNKIQQQIELDHLTGEIAIQLRASLLTMEASEKRMQLAKASMLAGCSQIVLCPAFTRAYQLQKTVEDRVRQIATDHWRIQNAKWISFRPLVTQKTELPELMETKQRFEGTITVSRGPLVSAARVWKEKGFHGWKIAWVK